MSQEVSRWTSRPSRVSSGVPPSCSGLGALRSWGCRWVPRMEMARPERTTPVQSGPLDLQFRLCVPFPPTPHRMGTTVSPVLATSLPRQPRMSLVPARAPSPQGCSPTGSPYLRHISEPAKPPNQRYVPKTHFRSSQSPGAALGDLPVAVTLGSDAP